MGLPLFCPPSSLVTSLGGTKATHRTDPAENSEGQEEPPETYVAPPPLSPNLAPGPVTRDSSHTAQNWRDPLPLCSEISVPIKKKQPSLHTTGAQPKKETCRLLRTHRTARAPPRPLRPIQRHPQWPFTTAPVTSQSSDAAKAEYRKNKMQKAGHGHDGVIVLAALGLFKNFSLFRHWQIFSVSRRQRFFTCRLAVLHRLQRSLCYRGPVFPRRFPLPCAHRPSFCGSWFFFWFYYVLVALWAGVSCCCSYSYKSKTIISQRQHTHSYFSCALYSWNFRRNHCYQAKETRITVFFVK